MTHTLELPESVERVLESRARRRGVALNAYLREVLQREAASEDSAATALTTTREDAIKAARGSMAQLPGSVAAFMNERSANDAFASDAR